MYKSEQLAEIILSSAKNQTLTGKNNRENISLTEVPRVISFDLNPENDLLVIDDMVADIRGEQSFNTKEDSIKIIAERLDEVTKGNGIEFIREDSLTKSILVFSKDYIDKLYSREEFLGTMILNYYKLWYLMKCGPQAPQLTEDYHARYKTFSSKEVANLKSKYIPVMVVSKELLPIYDLVKLLFESSALTQFTQTDSGYNIHGKRVEGSLSFWIPRVVASEYLDEQDEHKVLSYAVLEKLVRDAGLLDTPPIAEHKMMSTEQFSGKDITNLTENFLKSEFEKKQSSEEAADVKIHISSDIGVHDSYVPVKKKLTLDY